MLSKRRLVPFLTSLILSAVTVAYLMFIEHRAPNLRLANKTAGDVSVLLLSLVLLIGPLTRNFNFFDRWLAYRKNLGLWALLAAAVHSYITLFALTNNNPLRYFTKLNWGPITGLIALIMMLILGWYSVDKFIGKMNRKLWWKIQQYGLRLATILALVHILFLKMPGWKWSEFFTKLPPFNFIVSLVVILVLAARLTDWLRSVRKP